MSLSIRSLRAGIFAIASCFMLSCNVNEDQVRQVVREEMSKAMERKIVAPVQVVGPYSPAVRIGGFLVLSGQIGIDQGSGEIGNANIEVETRQALDNISIISSLGRIRFLGCCQCSGIFEEHGRLPENEFDLWRVL